MFIKHEEKAADAAFSISGYWGFRISGEKERDYCRISTKNGELL